MPLDNASIQRLLSPPVEVERGEWVEFLRVFVVHFED